MNNNEKFSVELELVTQKFNSKLDKIKNNVKQFAQMTKSNFMAGLNIDKTQTDKTLKELENKLSKVKENLVFDNNGNVISGIPRDIAEAQKLNNHIEEIKKTLEETNTTAGKLGSKFQQANTVLKKFKTNLNNVKIDKNLNSKPFENISTSINKGINKIKKFSLSLLSVRTVYSILSRASSSYLNQDSQLSNKLQSAWTGLGSMLAPIIEKLVNGFIKLVAYVNVFVKALTGVDFIAKASAKSLNKTSSSAKSMSKTLGGIDEITNIGDTSGGGLAGGAISDWTNAFNDVKLDPKWVEKIETLGKKVRKIWNEYFSPVLEWCKNHLDIVKGAILTIVGLKIGSKILGLGKKFLGLKSNAKEVTDVLGKKGGGGLIGSLATLAVMGEVIYITIKVKQDLDEMENFQNYVSKTIDNTITQWSNATFEQIEVYKENIKAGRMSEQQYRNIAKAVEEEISVQERNMLVQEKTIENDLTTTKNRELAIKGLLSRLSITKNLIAEEWNLYEANNLNDKEQSKLIDNLKNTNDKYSTLIKYLDNSSKEFKDVTNEITKNKVKLADLNSEEQKQINKLLDVNKTLDESSNEYKENKKKIEELSIVKSINMANSLNEEMAKLESLNETLDKNSSDYKYNQYAIEALAEQREIYMTNIKDEIKRLQDSNKTLDENSDEYRKNQDRIRDLTDELTDLAKGNYTPTVKVNADTSSAKKTLSNFFKNMGSGVFNTIFKGIGSFNSVLSRIASLDTGTNYVPSDQLAMIHKGEAVIPKKFNSSEYFNNDNSETNNLLRTLIEKVDNIEINPYTTIKDVGSASVEYINHQSRVSGIEVLDL